MDYKQNDIIFNFRPRNEVDIFTCLDKFFISQVHIREDLS